MIEFLNLLSISLLLFLLSLIYYFSYKKGYTELLVLLTILPLFLVLSKDTNLVKIPWLQISEFFSWSLITVLIAIIISYPFTFLFEKINKNLNLLLFLTLLIEWDWITTWIYLHNFSIKEVNTLLNINNFLIFSIQKLSFLLIFIIMYLISRKDKKLNKILEIGFSIVAVIYFFIFLWHIYVLSLFNRTIIFLIIPTFFSFFYFIFYFTLKNKKVLYKKVYH